MEKVQKSETQENFTNNYDESKVIDIKAMGLVKKRNRNDLEKNPINSTNGTNGNNDNVEEKLEKDNLSEKIIKSKNGELVSSENNK